VRRQFFWLLVLGAAAAAAIAYELGRRSRRRLTGPDAWTSFGEPLRDRPPEPAPGPPPEVPRPVTPRPREEAPTEAAPMVVATMEAPPATAQPRFPTNGPSSLVVEPEPAHAGSEAALGAIEFEQQLPRERRGLSGVTLAVLGALAGAGAIALGAWGIASSLSDDEGPTEPPAAVENVQQVVSLIAKPTTSTIPLQGSGRRIILVVGARGYGVLVLNNVAEPPAGKTYEAWVIRPSVKAPQPAGLFAGGTGVVKLTKSVPPGAVVAITVEPAGGSPAPTQQPKLIATRT
jgi:Anti-sigma-K factor rskA